MSSSEFAYGTEGVGHYSEIDALSLSRTNSDESLSDASESREQATATGSKEYLYSFPKAGGSESQAKEKGSEVMHECHCKICGKTFYAANKRQIICSKECKKIANREWSRRYNANHRGEIAERRKMRIEREKFEAAKKPDTIVGKGYAERQMAKSLEMAGKVRTEL